MSAVADIADATLLAMVDDAGSWPMVARAEHLAMLLAGDGPMTLGDRDRTLWAWKRRRFGPRALSVFDCTGCGAVISFAVPVGFDVPAAVAGQAVVQDWVLRLPTVQDVRAGFVMTALCPGAPWEDAGFRAQAAEALDAADPGMDVVFDVACADCGHVNARAFDVPAFVWADVVGRVDALMVDVAVLGRAFGWTEPQTLALPAVRRARYVEMVT
jgi:hypothetical protein